MVGSPAVTCSKATNTTPSQGKAPLPRSGFVHGGAKRTWINKLFVVSRYCRSDLVAFDFRKFDETRPNRNNCFDKQFSEVFGCVGAAILLVGNEAQKRPFFRNATSSNQRTATTWSTFHRADLR